MYAHQYNVGLNRLLTRDLALSADFTTVLRYGDRDTVEINIPDQVTRLRPYPTFVRVNFWQPTADNTYKALLLKVEKRMSRHYQALVSYTLSKAEDDTFTNALVGSLRLHEGEAPGRRRSPPPAGRQRHRRAAVRHAAVGDWRFPLEPAVWPDHLGPRPEQRHAVRNAVVAGELRPAGRRDCRCPGCRSLNLDAINQFRTQRSLTPVTQVDCPGFANVDLRFSKFFRIGGSARAEFIAQLFNIFDRANFATPNNNIGSAQRRDRPAAVRHEHVAAREHQRAVAAGGVRGAACSSDATACSWRVWADRLTAVGP